MARSLDPSDIQGGILNGYGKAFGAAGYLFLGAASAEAARGLLGEVAGRVTTAERWPEGAGARRRARP